MRQAQTFPAEARSQPRITRTTTVGSLKNASLIAAGESVERVVEKPRALVHAAIQHEVALVVEKTGLPEELPYECLSPSVHQCDDLLQEFTLMKAPH